MDERNSGIQSFAFKSELQLNVETLKKIANFCIPGPDPLLGYLGVPFSEKILSRVCQTWKRTSMTLKLSIYNRSNVYSSGFSKICWLRGVLFIP